MTPDSSWRHLSLVNNILHEKISRNSSDSFQPGDIACSNGSILACFYDYLEKSGHHLWARERSIRDSVTSQYRSCIVLRHLGDKRYLVCYLTTLNGQTYEYIRKHNALGYVFCLPLGKSTTWPGIRSIETTPPWWAPRSQAYVFTIPTVREDLIPTASTVRFRLVPGELERLIKTINDRWKQFDAVASDVRVMTTKWVAGKPDMRHTPKLDKVETPTRSATKRHEDADASASSMSFREFDDSITFTQKSVRWLTPPTARNDMTWLMRYLEEDAMNHSLYLNNTRQCRRHINIPPPFYAPSLRAKASTIMRMIR
ncbi:hypothetical protein BDQ12DRAFT_709795 [Crucibulum laeve]|uniref:Uncharacterized protein n=1 Tax=Crucibulum laeve TaxID=68775 RepID=A0A5C3MMT5_9AGAR|nr:hypothetical protein BDQ12DRAFT_709795 [Crucibulum laeve]